MGYLIGQAKADALRERHIWVALPGLALAGDQDAGLCADLHDLIARHQAGAPGRPARAVGDRPRGLGIIDPAHRKLRGVGLGDRPSPHIYFGRCDSTAL